MHADGLAGDLRFQARACADLGSPLYAALLTRAADDVERGGALSSVLVGWEHAPREAAVGLRLLGTVHRLVLAGQAPELAAYYPSVGGVPDAEAAWPALLRTVAAHQGTVRAGLTRPPQTNEVGRAATLLGGLLHVSAETGLPVRLAEVGASAGLNLLADRFRVDDEGGGGFGPATSPVHLEVAWRGAAPPVAGPLQVVERRGCDLSPVDPRSEEGRLTVTSYIWPDDDVRLTRLRGALEVARHTDVTVERAGAAEFLGRLRLRTGTALVLWHSVMWQYLDEAELAGANEQTARLAAEAGPDAPFAHLSFEPWQLQEADWRFLVTLRTWPGGVERVLGEAPPHGVPVTWW